MNTEDWRKLQEAEFAFLDTKDLRQIINENKDAEVYDIMCLIEDLYEDEYLEQNKEDECLFNVISEYEFAEYAKKKYGIRSYERTKYFFDV